MTDLAPVTRNQLRPLIVGMAVLALGLTAMVLWRSMVQIDEDREVTLQSELNNGMVAVRALEEHAAQTFQDAVASLDRVNTMIEHDKAAASGNIPALRRVIASHTLGQSRHLKALQFIAMDGTSWIASPDYPAHESNINDRSHIAFLLGHSDHTQAIVGHPYSSRYDSQLVVPVARNLYGKDQRHIGIVSVDIRLSYFGDLYSRMAKDNNACVALIAEDGFVIVRSPFEARYVDRDIASSPVLGRLKAEGAEGSFFDESFLDDELSRHYVFRKVTDLPMIAVYGRDPESIFSAWDQRRKSRLFFAYATSILVALMIAMMYVFINRLRIARNQLQQSQSKFYGLFEHSPSPLLLVQYPESLIIEINQAYSAQFGYTREEAVGKVTTSVNTWIDLEHRTRLIGELLKNSFLPPTDVLLRHRDGHVMTFALAASEFEAGAQRLFIFNLQDVTHQREVEREIRELNAQLEERVASRTAILEATNKELSTALSEKQAMQNELIRSEKMAALGSLVAGIAHELNTPIGNSVTVASSLNEYTHQLQTAIAANSLKKSQLDEFLVALKGGTTILMRTLDRAASLVSSFKQVAVDQTGDVRRKFHLESVLAEMVLTLAPVCKPTTHRFVLGQVEDVLMDGYPGALAQVINNFVNNSLLHAFEGREKGVMTISGRKCADNMVEIVFTDDGNGIDAAIMSKVFDPFFTTKMGAGGSGLGMHIVYNIVTGLLGGTVTLESEPGKGLTITLRLPMRAPEGRRIGDRLPG